MTYKITNNFKLHKINEFKESFTEDGNTMYYAFASRHIPYETGDSTIPSITDNEGTYTDLYNNMIFGKRISANDVFTVIPRHDWSSGTIYTEYDDQDTALSTKEFYAVVNSSSTYHVFKCLFNNGNTASTIEPDYASVDIEDEYYETSDGYIWKYMYSVNNSIVQKFATNEYFPVTTNANVSSLAVDGAIDVIKVIGTGNSYNNYIAGNNFFGATDLRLDGNTLLYDISSNSSSVAANDYYNGCYLYIKAGQAGEVGQYRKIVDYVVNSTAKAIQLESAFTNAISTSSVWEIYPGVIINGDGSQTINAEARAIVNSVGNTIHKIDMLNRGANYDDATAFVYSYPSVGSSNATLRVIKSPKNGHGYNPEKELGAEAISVSVSFSNSESNTIVTTNDYRTVGILKDPAYSFVEIEDKSTVGAFIGGEKVYKIEPMRLGIGATVSTTNTTVIAENADFENQFSSNDFIYLSDGSNHMLATVNTVVNSSYLELSSNSLFSSNNTSYYIPNETTFGYVSAIEATTTTLANVHGTFNSDDKIIGVNSGAYMIANTFYRSGENKNFDTFINMYKYTGNIITGSFIEDELVFNGGIDVANARLHSVSTNSSVSTMYVTNKFGTFNIPDDIAGVSSESFMLATEEYEPEIVFKSGDILYVENLNPITRQENQSETFKFIFEF